MIKLIECVLTILWSAYEPNKYTVERSRSLISSGIPVSRIVAVFDVFHE